MTYKYFFLNDDTDIFRVEVATGLVSTWCDAHYNPEPYWLGSDDADDDRESALILKELAETKAPVFNTLSEALSYWPEHTVLDCNGEPVKISEYRWFPYKLQTAVKHLL